jgi:hypothetical protein
VIDRVAAIAGDEAVLGRLVSETNARLQRQAPALQKWKRALLRALAEVKAEAERAVREWYAIKVDEGESFLADRLKDMGGRRAATEHGLREVDLALIQTKDQVVSLDAVRKALSQFGDVYGQLKPFERKELVRLVLHRAEVGDRQIVLEINGNAFAIAKAPDKSVSRFERPNWLPREDSNLEHSG